MMPLLTFSLKSFTDPDVLGRAAVTMLKVVDLPAPLGPSNPKISPLRTLKEFSVMALKPFG